MTIPQPGHDADLTAELRRFFGFPCFRGRQEEVVSRAVAGRDTLALMPTGAGKSLCYQLAAMLRPTPTLVISPLIALMKDQIDGLPPAVAERASFINSSLDAGEAARRLRELAAGRYKLIYAAPERLRQRQFVSALTTVDIGLVVIDEVHCVSMWGHDFRPDYFFIRPALESLGHPAVLGLTATATPETQEDIAASLGRDLHVVSASVVRPNLRYEVLSTANEEDRRRAALRIAQQRGGSGIIYARARQKCEQLAYLLQKNGVQALHYHAGLDALQRSEAQEKFLTGRVRVIVATIAFGMGIDKPDIRWVLLYNFPSSLESYVQMVGRAGRDGLPSVCTLLAGDADAMSLRRFARSDVPTVDQLRAVYRRLRAGAVDGEIQISAEELTACDGLAEDDDPRVLVGMLERAGLVRRGFDAGRAMQVALLPPPADVGVRIERLLQRYEVQALDRAGRMIDFGESRRCRHLQVARHFGETVQVPCGMCDVCAPGPQEFAVTEPPAAPLPPDIAAAILDAVDRLRWPVGLTGLAATLKGSVGTPTSARSSPGFGVLAAASESAVKRWIKLLVDEGHLVPFDNDGYKVLRVGKRTGLPRIAAASGPSLQSRRIREIAADDYAGVRPRVENGCPDVEMDVDLYGDDILNLVRPSPDAPRQRQP